jgi:hypothetical protein
MNTRVLHNSNLCMRYGRCVYDAILQQTAFRRVSNATSVKPKLYFELFETETSRQLVLEQHRKSSMKLVILEAWDTNTVVVTSDWTMQCDLASVKSLFIAA